MAERYTLKTDRYSSHSQIARWLIRHKARHLPERACVVYDIGCAQGFLGQILPARDFELYGVDSEAGAVEGARPFYTQVQRADIEGALTFTFPKPADVLVLADVLEHTRRPAECLAALCRRFLSSGARVVISLPNIAHLYVRLSLLLGRFNYAERGLLDRTHLQFFTRAAALQLARDCGLDVEETAATPVPLPLVNPAFAEGQPLWPLHQLNALSAQAWPTLLGYQIILYGLYRP